MHSTIEIYSKFKHPQNIKVVYGLVACMVVDKRSNCATACCSHFLTVNIQMSLYFLVDILSSSRHMQAGTAVRVHFTLDVDYSLMQHSQHHFLCLTIAASRDFFCCNVVLVRNVFSNLEILFMMLRHQFHTRTRTHMHTLFNPVLEHQRESKSFITGYFFQI